MCENEPLTFNLLSAALARHFGKATSIIALKEQLHSKERQPEEKLGIYAADVQRLNATGLPSASTSLAQQPARASSSRNPVLASSSCQPALANSSQQPEHASSGREPSIPSSGQQSSSPS
ncbi:hypothetical protein SKAU_G00124930 [Synaphobranchus kaupii]|uniref:Uncharacterized protein n=1 Tax=Synaphobranchus kaupii TaxID=118154 RepID=A0A9Q1J0M8_SYNKA|nr:hypothetical protein SKAU_G00124930 [Synaphobranchus kaupii]